MERSAIDDAGRSTERVIETFKDLQGSERPRGLSAAIDGSSGCSVMHLSSEKGNAGAGRLEKYQRLAHQRRAGYAQHRGKALGVTS